MINEISTHELKKKLEKNEAFTLLDVRDLDEYKTCHIKQSTLIPLNELSAKVETLNKQKPIVVYCKMGGRSAQACVFLQENGFENVSNLEGGIRKWALEIDPSMPLY